MIHQLLIIGCGNMGGAMLAGWLASGVDPERFAVLDPAIDQVPEGVALYREVDEANTAGAHDAVLLGFKPQQLGAIGAGLQSLIGHEVTLNSLLAGLTVAQLKSAFPSAGAYVRVMPNLAARINKSPVILTQSGLSETASEAAFSLFDRLGTAFWLEDESQFDLVTALAGSGPGFVYRFIDALAEAGARLGLERDAATRLALATVDGASALAATADVSPNELANRVASPGGMTREGLNVLDADEVLIALLTDTLSSTAKRGAQLSAESG